MDDCAPVKHSIKIAGHATSITLEPLFWDVLKQLSTAQQKTLTDLIATIDRTRQSNLSSALRIYVLQAALAGKVMRNDAEDGNLVTQKTENP